MGLQNLAMLRSGNTGNRVNDDSVRFKTIDGNDVSVAITVVWQLEPSKAPFVLAKVGGSTDEVEQKLVRPVSRTVVRDVLNELTSEEYYKADTQDKGTAEVIITKHRNGPTATVRLTFLGEYTKFENFASGSSYRA